MLVGNGPYGVRRGQAVAGGRAPGAGRGLGVVREVPAHAGVEQARAAAWARPRRRSRSAAPAGSRPSSASVTSGEATRLPGLPERAVLLDGEGREPEVAEHVHAGRRRRSGGGRPGSRRARGRRGWRDARARSAASRPMAAASIAVASTAHLLRVARPVVGAHGHGQELGAGPALGGADALRASRPRPPRRRGERAVGGDARLVGGGDDRAGALGAELRAGGRRCRRTRPPGGARRRPASGRPGPVLELLDVRGDGRGPLHERADALRRPRARCSRRRPGGPARSAG